jgi:tellurite resistance protein
MSMVRYPVVPASFFGIILGLTGLGGGWRVASRLWGLPWAISECIMSLAAVVWIILIVLYTLKWLVDRERALAEVRDAVLCCFVGLVPATFALMGLALLPHSHDGAFVLWVLGSAGQLIFGVFRSGGMWRGNRELTTVTPILFLPTVAGNFITSIVAGALGQTSWGILFFGIGFFNWLVMESVILFRLWMAPPIGEPSRPVIGIHLAPAAVGATAYLANTHGTPDLFVQAMWGYGIFQVLMAARLMPWIARQPFAASYWGFSFAMAAIGTGALVMTLRGVSGAIAMLAIPVFVVSNLVIAALIVGSVVRLAQGRLLPPVAPVAPVVSGG